MHSPESNTMPSRMSPGPDRASADGRTSAAISRLRPLGKDYSRYLDALVAQFGRPLGDGNPPFSGCGVKPF
jgi:hypothetical protein